MDSVWFLIGCGSFAWLVAWSLRDFSKPSRLFWPFDARWMRRSPGAEGEAASPARGWRRKPAADRRRRG